MMIALKTASYDSRDGVTIEATGLARERPRRFPSEPRLSATAMAE